MFFSVQELEVRKIHFDVDFPPGEINLDESQVRQVGPLHAEGTAELLSNTLGEIRVHGNIDVAVEIVCDRCLEPAQFPIQGPFELFYRPEPEFEAGHDMAIDEGEAQIGFYEKNGLALEEVLREHVLLSLPMQFVCREDCAGICPQCGKNRNLGACNCEDRPQNETWSALRGFKPGAKTGS